MLSEAFVRDGIVADLGRHPARFTSMQHLDLGQNRFFHGGGHSVRAPACNITSLQHLDPTLNSIGHTGVTALDPHLAGLTSLQHLDIGVTHFGALGATAFGPHLARFASLKHLDVRRARIVQTLSQHWGHLVGLTCMQTRCLGVDDIGPESGTFLGAHLAGLSSLQCLSL